MSEDTQLYELFKHGQGQGHHGHGPHVDLSHEEDYGDEYNPVEMLRDVIETIRDTESPDDVAGDFGYIDPALEIIYEIADRLSEDIIEDIIQALFEYYLNDDDDFENPWDHVESVDVELSDDEKLELFENFELLDEAVNAVQKKRLRYLKKKRRSQLGKRGNSQAFKRNYHFDSKKKKFVKRNKAISVSAMRKKARIFKKTMRRGSSKAKNKRMKKRLVNVRNPYGK